MMKITVIILFFICLVLVAFGYNKNFTQIVIADIKVDEEEVMEVDKNSYADTEVEDVEIVGMVEASELKNSTSTLDKVTDSPQKTIPTKASNTSATVKAPVEKKKIINIVDCDIGNFSDQFLCLINGYRNSLGKNSLIYNLEITKAALAHSAWMNETGNFSHVGKEGSAFYERCEDVGAKCDGENIAYGFTSAQMLFEMWKNSPGHNAIMLGEHSLMGLGIVGKYATANFK